MSLDLANCFESQSVAVGKVAALVVHSSVTFERKKLSRNLHDPAVPYPTINVCISSNHMEK